ncbi:hypothetical protein A0J48_007045 [Sphaerospermopsis aphanizomenoides BCCUSP55]|uniref:hypothetical protein n=1 Tax=Sphaerospermopsis aphanizomenoides TaxID=459663 RepID=UPI00190371C2|nr:hypothetical protein [Sphaerospermopsis aphanizomenoides]MBK1987292.1 hypothetical protein [Sphaerospermopsis aphanizomenoides BCCUSP55]
MQLTLFKPKFSIFTFTLMWSFATLISFLLSLCLIEIGEEPDVGILAAAVGGLAIALPQSYILRQTIFPLGWILSTVLGWVLITVIGVGAVGWYVLSTELLHLRILFAIISGAVGGLMIGIAQWWLAIPSSVNWGWCWMFLSAASWAVALPVGSVTGMFLRRFTGLFLGEVVGLVIAWLIVGILTGITAYKLFRK